MNDRGISGAELARRIGRFQDYIATGLHREAQFNISNIDIVADPFGVDPIELLLKATK